MSESTISIDTLVAILKKNPEKFKIKDILVLIKTKYTDLAEDILNLTLAELIDNTIVNEQDQCEKEIIKNYGKIIKLKIADIQRLIKNCDRLILAKAIKLFEQPNSTGFRMKSMGSKKGRKYTLVKDEEYEDQQSVPTMNLNEDTDEDDEDDFNIDDDL